MAPNVPDLDKALPYYVTHHSGVKAVIDVRFYPQRLPQTVTLPAATFQAIGGAGPVPQHGAAGLLPRQRYQVTAFGQQADLVAVDRALKAALDGYRGTWGTGAYLTEIECCLVVSAPVDDSDPESGLAWRSRDYLIIWKE